MENIDNINDDILKDLHTKSLWIFRHKNQKEVWKSLLRNFKQCCAKKIIKVISELTVLVYFQDKWKVN